jgi:hypothetical protein
VSEPRPFPAITIVRYGLPLLIGVFYFVAASGFAFTADAGFGTAAALKFGMQNLYEHGSATPLWQGVVAASRIFSLDPLLVTKVLSLVFSCTALLAAYLVAREVTGDVLISLSVALVFSMQGWLLQTAPSGSALPFATVLVLTALFFMLRNEYLVAIIVIGLCTLLFWQGALLIVPFAADLWFNSVSRQRALKVGGSALMVFSAVILPWILIARFNDLPLLPVLPPTGEFPPPSALMVILTFLLVAVAIAGVVLAFARRRVSSGSVPINAGALLFGLALLAFNPMANSDLWLTVLPVFIACAFRGIAEILFRFRKVGILYPAIVLASALLLAASQHEFRSFTQPAMLRANALQEQNRIAAQWVRANIPDRSTLGAEYPGVIAYDTGREVARVEEEKNPGEDLIISVRPVAADYAVAFLTPPALSGDSHERVAIWRRR